jgi:hypothetical protein
MITQVPPLLNWHICLLNIKFFPLVVNTCALNKSRGHWLLIYAFNFAISISMKLDTKLENAPSFQTLMEKDYNVALELICLTSNIRMEVCIVLDSFLSFLKK